MLTTVPLGVLSQELSNDQESDQLLSQAAAQQHSVRDVVLVLAISYPKKLMQ